MKQIIYISVIGLLAILASCTKNKDEPLFQEPTFDNSLLVNTLTATAISCNNAQLKGEIKASIQFEEKGAVISTHSLPTISDTKLKDASTSVTTIAVLASNLPQKTKYFYRTYIIKSGVAIYGNEGFFTTTSCNGSNNAIVDTNFYCELQFDGKTYRVNYDGINFAPLINPNFNHNSNADPIAGMYSNIENNGTSQFVLSKNGGLDAGFQIHLNEILQQGTFSINSSNYDSGDRDIAANTGLSNIATVLAYDLEMYNRVKNGSNCLPTHLNTKGTLTWNITSKTQIVVPTLTFAFPTSTMNIYEGNFSGTMYENTQTDINCQNSRAVTYSCTFRMPCPAYQ